MMWEWLVWDGRNFFFFPQGIHPWLGTESGQRAEPELFLPTPEKTLPTQTPLLNCTGVPTPDQTRCALVWKWHKETQILQQCVAAFRCQQHTKSSNSAFWLQIWKKKKNVFLYKIQFYWLKGMETSFLFPFLLLSQDGFWKASIGKSSSLVLSFVKIAGMKLLPAPTLVRAISLGTAHLCRWP